MGFASRSAGWSLVFRVLSDVERRACPGEPATPTCILPNPPDVPGRAAPPTTSPLPTRDQEPPKTIPIQEELGVQGARIAQAWVQVLIRLSFCFLPGDRPKGSSPGYLRAPGLEGISRGRRHCLPRKPADRWKPVLELAWAWPQCPSQGGSACPQIYLVAADLSTDDFLVTLGRLRVSLPVAPV